MFKIPTADGMSRFMISNNPFFIRRNDLAFLFKTSNNPVNRVLEIFHLYASFSFSRSDQCSLITNVRYICACKPRSLFGQFFNIYPVRNFDWFQVHFKDRFPAFHIRLVNRDLPVKSSRTQQRRIQYIRPISGSEDNDSALSTKSIHLNQQLIQRAFTLIVAHDSVLSSRTANRIDLINKYDTWRFLSCLFEKV